MGQIEIFNHFLYLEPINCVQTNVMLNWFISITKGWRAWDREKEKEGEQETQREGERA